RPILERTIYFVGDSWGNCTFIIIYDGRNFCGASLIWLGMRSIYQPHLGNLAVQINGAWAIQRKGGGGSGGGGWGVGCGLGWGDGCWVEKGGGGGGEKGGEYPLS